MHTRKASFRLLSIVASGLILVSIILVLLVPSADRAYCFDSWGNLSSCVKAAPYLVKEAPYRQKAWINKYVYWQNPCPKEEIVTTEEGKRPTKEFMREVAHRNRDRFYQHPGVHGYTSGSYRSGPYETSSKGYGITVFVDTSDGAKIPTKPKCVEGIPVRYVPEYRVEPK